MTRPSMPPQHVVWPATLGAATCASLIALSSDFQAAVDLSPAFLSWLVLVAAEGALAGVGIVSIKRLLNEERLRPGRTSKLASLLGVMALLGVFAAAQLSFPIHVCWPLGETHRLRVLSFTLLVLTPALMAIVLMWRVAERDLAAAPGVDAKQTVSSYLDARALVESLARYNGMLIGGAVLATGALRNAMLAHAAHASTACASYATEDAFPAVLVLSYGGAFAVVLAVAYTPVHLHLQTKGEQLLATLSQDKPLAEWLESRAELRKLLGLDLDLQSTLSGAISVLGPILGSLLSQAIPNGH